ncbi:MAG: acetylornithine/succinylornithine family transaminase [Alphaproteobacteria bacterium]|nr:acetylornithine/succinylornithine family transaminase [Alphaproteobacteria bacterium]
MSEQAKKIIDETFSLLVKTYSPQPVVLDRAQGCRVWDTEGKPYLDFAAGIAVVSLGHANPAVLKTINEQAAKLMMCQASYATAPKLKAAKLLTENSFAEIVYFCNSGAEAIETAMKCARKWAYEAKGPACNEIIAFHNSFHGRTYGAASITEKRHTQPFFEPYVPATHFADFNNFESVEKLVNHNTAAIFIEPVQGEGGLASADPDFLKALRKLCDDKNICLVFDEVQAGMGRTGTLNAYEQFGVEPDLITWAKGLGSGFPVGAMGARKKFGEAIVAGTHGTTYGGNPLACAVTATVIEEMLKPGFFENAQKVSKIMLEGLNEIKRASNKVTAVKGRGLMIGLDTMFEIKDLLGALQKNGLMATQAGKNTLRLTPPLTLSEDEANEALKIIEKTVQELEA